MKIQKYLFKALLTPEGWLEQAVVTVDSLGKIESIKQYIADETIDERVEGYALPSFQNAHSHAFQYAMAGLAEYHEGQTDDFWSWRNAMYDLALRVSPEQLEAIATQLYAQMACMGYTAVAEFHYLHHQHNGKPFENTSEMGQSLMRAAQRAGLHLTLIPILYQQGGIHQPPTEKQRRFIHADIEDFFTLIESSQKASSTFERVNIGIGAHSIRAVNLENLRRLVAYRLPNQAFHIHIAEQLKEVEDAQRNLKQRPVEWLFSNIEVDQHFHLVHATHITAKEMEMILTSRANVVICPSTEANLGDGIFPFNAFYAKNENWSIGTDSHIGLNHLEELRWLDYGQRLIHHQRTSFIHQGQPDGAQNAFMSSWKGGRNAMGLSSAHFFEIGDYFDAVVIDASEPLIATTSLKHLCNTVLYAQNQSMIYGTISAGKWIVKQGKHQHAESIQKNFVETIRKIANR